MTPGSNGHSTRSHAAGCADGQRAVDLSVVLPFRNEAGNLPELLSRLRATLGNLLLSYELVFVDDGSSDVGPAYLESEARADRHIKLIVLSRNFGQHAAATAGFDAARGRLVLWMDSDLQERPEDIPRLIDKQREGFDVVYARRDVRRQSRIRAGVSNLCLTILDRTIGLHVPADRACMRLMTQEVVRSLRSLRERNRYLGYLMPWVGFRAAEVDIQIDPRGAGKTNYSWWKLVKMAITGLTAFTTAPLRLCAVFGGLACFGCVLGIIWILYGYFTHGYGVSGWATLVTLLLGLHGMTFLFLAILGEYVGLTYTETKNRPLYLCRKAVNLEAMRPSHRDHAIVESATAPRDGLDEPDAPTLIPDSKSHPSEPALFSTDQSNS